MTSLASMAAAQSLYDHEPHLRLAHGAIESARRTRAVDAASTGGSACQPQESAQNLYRNRYRTDAGRDCDVRKRCAAGVQIRQGQEALSRIPRCECSGDQGTARLRRMDEIG